MRRSNLIVMKFGGSSVANAEKIERAAQHVERERRLGAKLAVVVSAPADMTDDLLGLAASITSKPQARELDMLLASGEQVSIALFAMALQKRAMPAVSLTGPQAGITLEPFFGNARIFSINPKRILAALGQGQVAVIAGFQGGHQNGEIATMGRGGSDLTAVALAANLGAQRCEVFTDVEGIYTADPRLVPEAKKLSFVDYDVMFELTSSGAQVMQARSIALAKKYRVPIHVRSSLSGRPGTWIGVKPIGGDNRQMMEDAVVTGISLDKNLAKLTIADVADRPGAAARVFSLLADKNIAVDMIVQGASKSARFNDISLTVARPQAASAYKTLLDARGLVGAKKVLANHRVAKVAAVGLGLQRQTWVAAKMFSCLAGSGINIQMISTSDIKIACIIAEEEGERALARLHETFKLGRRRTERTPLRPNSSLRH